MVHDSPTGSEWKPLGLKNEKVHIDNGCAGPICGVSKVAILVIMKEHWLEIPYWDRCGNCNRWYDANIRYKTPEDRRASIRAL